jgi:hypothetical protein
MDPLVDQLFAGVMTEQILGRIRKGELWLENFH